MKRTLLTCFFKLIVLQSLFAMSDLDFEKKIAYFYGVSEPDKVAHYYVLALEAQHKVPQDSELWHYRCAMMGPLTEAYEEVKRQTEWELDAKKAADYEFDLFTPKEQDLSFDNLVDTLQSLYALVFKGTKEEFLKIAYLRIFLFQYKDILEKDKKGGLSKEDKQFLISLAERSEKELKEKSALMKTKAQEEKK